MRFADRVKETTTTTGTGSVTLAGAAAGFDAFQDVFAVGDPVCYAIVNSTTEWEVGIGTLSSTTVLARSEVISNSSGTTTAINFGAGTKDVFCSPPASFVQQLVSRGVSIALASGSFIS